MMILDPSLMRSAVPSEGCYARDMRIVLAAGQLYERARSRGRLSRLWKLITRRPRRLLDLTTIEAVANMHTRHYLGVHMVRIQQIWGSESRSADFDALFYPRQGHTRQRWVSIAAARMMGAVLPPVELIQLGNGYFVRDGHHRISVARALGEEYIDAEVTVLQVSQPLPEKWPVWPIVAQLPVMSPPVTAGNLDQSR